MSNLWNVEELHHATQCTVITAASPPLCCLNHRLDAPALSKLRSAEELHHAMCTIEALATQGRWQLGITPDTRLASCCCPALHRRLQKGLVFGHALRQQVACIHEKRMRHRQAAFQSIGRRQACGITTRYHVKDTTSQRAPLSGLAWTEPACVHC